MCPLEHGFLLTDAELAQLMRTLTMGNQLGKEESPEKGPFAYTSSEFMVSLRAFRSQLWKTA
jgi:hypothetical protein